jgi:phosphopantetheinyl transferase
MGIASIERFSNTASLGLWQITESVETLLSRLVLSSSEQQRFKTKKTDSRKKEWLACRNLLGEMLGRNPLIEYDSQEKPFLTDDNTYISLSHSGVYAAVYVNSEKAVGVDIQKLKPSISNGADFFLNEAELQWADLSNNNSLHLIWAVKEAVFKLVGSKELDFRKDIDLKPFESNQNKPIEVSIFNQQTIQNTKVCHSFFEDYVLTWTI